MITRSADGIIAGVSAGLAKRFDVEPWLVRFLWVIGVFGFGISVFFYLLLVVSLPREDKVHLAFERKILGVCSGLALRAQMDVGVVRALTLFLLFASGGLVFAAYVVIFFALPTLPSTGAGGTLPPTSTNPEPSRNESSSN